jgi:hypothetical protein
VIDTGSYDAKVLDASGWIYLLPPLRGSRLLCIDAVGNVAHRLAAEGAEVSVVLPDARTRWKAEFLNPSSRPSARRVRFADQDGGNGDWRQSPPRPYDGIVLHDLQGTIIRGRTLPAVVRMLQGLSRHLGSQAFIYVGALQCWSPWLVGRSLRAVGSPSGRKGASRRQLHGLMHALGTGCVDEYPYLLSGADVVEIIGARGYRSTKNRELRVERVKEMILRPGLAQRFSPAVGLVGFTGARQAGIIDLLRDRLDYPGREPGDGRPTLAECLVLHAGKVILGLRCRGAANPDLTVAMTQDFLAVRRRETEAATLLALAALPDCVSGLLPKSLGRLEVEGVHAFVLTTRPGVTCDLVIPRIATVTRQAAAFLVDLHRHTRLACEPLGCASKIAALCTAAMERLPLLKDSLLALHEAIETCAGAFDFPLVCMHGDFKIENVMYDAGTGALTGVIDWELAQLDGLPLLDLLYLLAFNRMIHGQSRFEAFRALSLGDGLEQVELDLISGYLEQLDIPAAQRLPLAVAFVCHDMGCRMQFDDLPANAPPAVEAFLAELRGRLLAWRPAPAPARLFCGHASEPAPDQAHEDPRAANLIPALPQK